MTNIKQWNEIKSDFSDGLLLGNGASIAIYKKFSYKSLKQHAIEKGLFTDQIKLLFEEFNTEDFELILRLVWHAYLVNNVLEIYSDKTDKAYKEIRDVFIDSVRDIHCSYTEVFNQFAQIYKFSKNFKTICSLNYDLTLYWSIMYEKDTDGSHAFKDCFNAKYFSEDWKEYREPINNQKKCTLVFYPHGNLALARDKIGEEIKINASGNELLNSIISNWKKGICTPLFVSEGTSKQKIKSIQSSYYLSTVYRDVLFDLGESLVIYGWNIGEHDQHIIKRICTGGTRKFAISVFPDGNEGAYCNHVTNVIKSICKDKKTEIVFFNSKSKGCWNN